MQRKFLFIAAIVACIVLVNWRCAKLDSTTLGADLIPAVDNVTTFADTFLIDAAREQNIDTTTLTRTETHALGSINNDPVFGKTKADVFLELKPTFFPFYLGNSTDTITKIDSVFLCLSFTGFYGDSTKPQHFKVYQIDKSNTDFVDTIAYGFNYKPNPYPTNLLGEATINEQDLKNFTFLNTNLKDSVSNQIRIPLTNATFINDLLHGDSTSSGVNNYYRSDSLFKDKFKGFAVVADGGSAANGLFYVNLADAATRLEIFHVAKHGTLDTAFTSFPLSVGSTSTVSATANAIVRDTSASEFPRAMDPNALYIQSAPGSAINLKIPKLTGWPNRIVHRAEIFLEQVPGSVGNDVLQAPSFLYLDLIDDTSSSTVKKYKPLYYDLNPTDVYDPDNSSVFFPTTGIDYTYYGGYLRTFTGGIGTRSYYTFNLTRYVQNMVTHGGKNYTLRVYAPYNLSYNGLHFLYRNNLGAGRVKIYNGPDANYRIRMRVVWSKI